MKEVRTNQHVTPEHDSERPRFSTRLRSRGRRVLAAGAIVGAAISPTVFEPEIHDAAIAASAGIAHFVEGEVDQIVQANAAENKRASQNWKTFTNAVTSIFENTGEAHEPSTQATQIPSFSARKTIEEACNQPLTGGPLNCPGPDGNLETLADNVSVYTDNGKVALRNHGDPNIPTLEEMQQVPLKKHLVLHPPTGGPIEVYWTDLGTNPILAAEQLVTLG